MFLREMSEQAAGAGMDAACEMSGPGGDDNLADDDDVGSKPGEQVTRVGSPQIRTSLRLFATVPN